MRGCDNRRKAARLALRLGRVLVNETLKGWLGVNTFEALLEELANIGYDESVRWLTGRGLSAKEVDKVFEEVEECVQRHFREE